jgi:hypothetical protein
MLCVFALAPAVALAQPPREEPRPETPSPTIPKSAESAITQDSLPEKEEQAKAHAWQSLFVHGDYTLIPLPAFAYTRNESYWAGALMPILKANPKGELEHILAPQYLWNRFVGHTATVNYYRYVSDTTQYHAVASYSEKVQKDFDLGYKNLRAGGGRYILGAEINWLKDPFARFFGFGNRAPERNETNYTARETRAKLTAGINLTPDFSVMLTERYHDVRLETGVIPSLPQTMQQFQNTPGVEGAQIVGHRLTLFYDTREHQLTPVRGSYLNLSAEFNQNLQHAEPNRWWRYTVDARHLIPHASDRMVFVAHALLDAVNRANRAELAIPFYERPTLGGETTLRAFGLSRFIDNTAWLVNLEERIQMVEKKLFDYPIDLEAAPFVDIGRVSRRLDPYRIPLKHIQVNPGVGLRLLARPNVVGRLDVAYGKDGGNVFVGLDYPF